MDKKTYNRNYYLQTREKKMKKSLDYYYENLINDEYKKRKAIYDKNRYKNKKRPNPVFEIKHNVTIAF